MSRLNQVINVLAQRILEVDPEADLELYQDNAEEQVVRVIDPLQEIEVQPDHDQLMEAAGPREPELVIQPQPVETGDEARELPQALDNENKLIEALGGDPTVDDAIEVPMHKTLINTWTYWMKRGISVEDLEILLYQYRVPEFLRAPILNQELRIRLEKDKKFQIRNKDTSRMLEQELTSTALLTVAALIASINSRIDVSFKDDLGYELIKMAQETAKALSHLFYEQTLARRDAITPEVQDYFKKSVLLEQETDTHLFGSNLPEKMKDINSIMRTANELGNPKPSSIAEKKDQTNTNTNTSQKLDFLDQRKTWPGRNNQNFSGRGQQRGRKSFNRRIPPYNRQFSNNNNRPKTQQAQKK